MPDGCSGGGYPLRVPDQGGTAGKSRPPTTPLRAKGVRFITDGDRAPDNMLLLYRAMQYASNLNLTFALRETCRP